MNIYERIDGSKYRNIWVVGDLHGCYTNLMNKLDTIGFDNKKDLLISVGDLVDRGAENEPPRKSWRLNSLRKR